MEETKPVKAEVSVCIIARDESSRLQRLLPAIRDYVKEIIVVDTGSRDNTPEIASKYADKVVLYTECNNPDTGLIEDFSKARNHSFSLATQPWLLWVDADDEVSGIENLPKLIDRYRDKYGDKPGSYQFPYEYANDGDGRCTMRLYRERFMSPPKAFKFINEVHEVCVPIDPFNFIQEKVDDVIIKHNRSDKPAMEPARNMRILRTMNDRYKETEPRVLYYLGLEYANLGNFSKSVEFLEKYVKISGWDDEICMALMKLCEIHSLLGDHQAMIDTAKRAIKVKETWGEPYFYLAAGHYALAEMRDDPIKNWTLCAQYAKFGLLLPPTDTLLFINPMYRLVEIHRYLNVALGELGKTQEAIVSVEEALKTVPKDKALLTNKQTYLVRLAKETAKKSLDELNTNGVIVQDTHDRMFNLLDGKIEDDVVVFAKYNKEQHPNAMHTPHSQAWAIPSEFEFDATPVQLTNEQLQASVLMIWKQYLANHEVVSALSFLDNAPYRIRHTPTTERARQYTQEMISPVSFAMPYSGDTISSSHAYEKLLDPINELIVPTKNVMDLDSKFVLTTTNGSADGYGWKLEPKSVLSAPTTRSLISQFKQAGYHIDNAFPIENEIVIEARLPNSEPKLDIIFWLGDGLEPWTPITAKKDGIGGSETMAVELSKRLAAMGHKIRVYTGCGTGEGIYDGVEYIDTNKFPGTKCDVLIVSRNASMLSTNYNIQCKMNLLWCHDILPVNGRNGFLLEAYRIFALSEPHRQHMLNEMNIHSDHIITTRNGIDLSRFNKVLPRNRFKAINSSSPDRSWLDLFDVWPEIKKRVPQAELHLYYGFDNWEKIARRQGTVAALYAYKRKVKEMEQYGVVSHGRIDQQTLADEMLSAGVCVYPTNFFESSCQLAGTLIFTNNGMVPIEDIKVGDMVLTHMGRFRKVTELIRKEYNGDLYSVKRKKDFNPITLTAEHPLYVSTFHKRSDAVGNRVYSLNNQQFHWKTPGALVPKLDYLVSPKMEFGNQQTIKITDYVDNLIEIDGYCYGKKKWKSTTTFHSKAHKIKNEIVIDEKFMYMLGLFAAEGCVSKSSKRNNYSSMTFAFHEREKETLAKAIIDYFGFGNIRQTSEHGIIATVYSSTWAYLLKTLIGTHRQKTIPAFVWNTSKENQKAFLQGMLDGDGSKPMLRRQNIKGEIVEYQANTYISISPSLAYGAAQLLANQGVFVGMHYDKDRKAYALHWQPNATNNYHHEVPNGYATRVQSIEIKHYEGIVYNFEVEEDQSYTTDRTVVHNCISMMEMQAAGVRMITSDFGALKETVGNRGVLIEGNASSEEYRAQFIEATVAAMTNEDDSDRLVMQQYAQEHFSLDTLAKDWDAMIYDLLSKTDDFPLVSYQPTEKFGNKKGE